MNNKTKATKAAATGLAGLAVGMVATFALVSELAADTPDSTAVERQESASAQQYTGPQTADAAEHWLRWSNRNEDRIVRHQTHRIVSGKMSMQEFGAIARTRVANRDWSQDTVDRIVYAARIETLARRHQGCGVFSAGTFGRGVVGC
jgi:hypothetical protein